MKRIIFTIITIAVWAMASPARGLDIQYGARAGFEITMPDGSHNIYKTGSGFQAGGIARIALPKSFYVEPGLYIYYTSMDARYLTVLDGEYPYEGQAKTYGLRIPVNIGYSLEVGQLWAVNFGTGPYMNINLRARQSYEPNFSAPERVPKGSTDLFNHGWRHVEAGWGVGVSVTYARHYELGVCAGFNFTPMAKIDANGKEYKVHRNMIAITLGYNF